MVAIFIIIILTLTGLFFGILLAVANKMFAVETDPRVHEVDEVLPKGQCGACGYAGCIGYAEAVVNNPDVPTNLCAPGKAEVAQKIAEITGKTALLTESKIASVKCAGSRDNAIQIFEYKGIHGCVSANLLQGGNKACKYGCLGFGTCVKGCFFNALKMGDNGLPIVNPDKCVGCGKCETLCPKHIIEMIPRDSLVRINCKSIDKGGVSRRFCKVSCIGCKRCEKECPHGAIKVENNLAKVDENICIEKCSDPVCLANCPTKAITSMVGGVNKVELKASRWRNG